MNRFSQYCRAFFAVFKKKYVSIPLILFLTFTALYCMAVFSNLPFIAYWRGLYIETAMTTADHQWLATAFIPQSVIDEVMKKKVDTSQIVGGKEHLIETTAPSVTAEPTPEDSSVADSDSTPIQAPIEEEPSDILNQASLVVGEPDYAGYTVLVNDLDEGIVISEIVGSSYRGKIMLIDDPSRVYLGTTTKKNEEGLRIKAMMAEYDAIAGINASGFHDPNDSGHGGDVIGLSYSDGEFWGEAVSYYGSVLLTSDNQLVVGNVKDWEKYDIRAGIQFGPVLIADGKEAISGSGGYGIQPRTVIGQRADGVIVFLVIDGRQPTWSIGCTVGDLVEILLSYDVVNAACCDGGSSSVMAYNGEVINKNSSANPTYGRRLPNAWLVASKKPSDE